MSRARCCLYHMTCEEYGLWLYLRAVAPHSRVFSLSGRAIANSFANTSCATTYRVLKLLVTHGWLEVIKTRRRSAKGCFAAAQYRALSHERWAEKHPGECHL